MNFAALKQELSDRGFQYLSDPRLGNYVNWARAELDGMMLWPYRQATQTGVPPLTVLDIGVIESVYDSTADTMIAPSTYAQVLSYYREATSLGVPLVWYLGAGGSTVQTYPVATYPLEVRYFKTPPDLVASTDTPLAPARFHGLIVDMAVRRGYMNSDNASVAAALQGQIDRDLANMTFDLLQGQVQASGQYVDAVGLDC